jgi:membrane protease YdiL (CAAX protease family)
MFARRLGFDLRTAVGLVSVFGAVRVLLVLQANVTGSYQAVSVVFVAMAALPWVVLSRGGRLRVGIARPQRWRWMLPAFLSGGVASPAVFAAFRALWGESARNAFVYIGGTYSAVPDGVSPGDRAIFFVVFAVIGLTFSPIGEELLYRGIAHEAFAARFGARTAALLDAGAFAVVHLAHFGVVYVAGGWALWAGPGALWFAAMFGGALLFGLFRSLAGSILGAVVAHAGFNLGMTAVIFYGVDLF